MKRTNATKLLALTLCANLGLVSPQVALAEDIDIFLGTSAGNTINPRILIVLDNTSNWSRQNQQWPGGKTQGQSEADAIKTVVRSLRFSESDPDEKKVSVGLMEFVTGGNANDDGGFVRSAVRDMTPANVNSLEAELTEISANINSPDEKRNSGTPYGNLMYDVHNYFAGGNSYSPSATLASKADYGGYDTAFSKFKSPLTSANTCGRSFMIFIGNPNSSGPSADNSDNTARLRAANGNVAVTQLGLPDFESRAVSTNFKLGSTAACYSSKTSAVSAATTELTPYATQCLGYTDGCSIGEVTANDSATACPANTSKYEIRAVDTVITNVALDKTTVDTKPYNADEWARLMHDKGILIPGTTSTRSKVTTYTIDVHNKQPNAQHTALLLSMAKVGGGRYFKATNEDAIVDALREIMVEIQAVNSSFASTSLPVNATNRSQNLNQVFIGMFRPDKNSKPRWFGNLKRYQLIKEGATIKLADARGIEAVNPLTGFLTPCAVSYWTRDSNNYWQGKGVDPDPISQCNPLSADKYSDTPDGPFVEKGGAAQVVREGNNRATGVVADEAVNRTMLTLGATGFVPFTAAASGLDSGLVDWIRGKDVDNEKSTNVRTTTRPSIHGDVIHSRPQPVNYGSPTDTNPVVSVYYGANDGTLRAVDAASGVERWSFVPPEFFSRLSRIRDNTTRVLFPGMVPGFTPTPTRKDYFFDGSIGVYQNANNSTVWIFPSMRRGGRMLYGINVTNPATPVFKWRAGCPNLTNQTGCTEGMEDIGQTWSTPSVARIRGFSTSTPVLVVGGGYDGCEDADNAAPSCGQAKGGFIYILNADTGALLRKFRTDRPVPSDVAMVDINNDASPDYAYAADTGGNIYRIDFIDGPTTRIPLSDTQWTSRKVATTAQTSGRKFLHSPALLYSQNKVYVALGSGDREHPMVGDYPYVSNVVNRFYVYLDNLSAAATSDAVNLDGMRDHTLTDSCTTAAVLPDSGLAGWFMDLSPNGRGEQVVTSALIAGGMVTFSTNRPIPEPRASCATTLGEARGYWVNLLNGAGAIGVPGACGGTRSSVFVGGGLPPSPVFANGVGIGTGTQSDTVSVVLGAVQKDGQGVNTPISPVEMRPQISMKRKRAYSYSKGD